MPHRKEALQNIAGRFEAANRNARTPVKLDNHCIVLQRLLPFSNLGAVPETSLQQVHTNPTMLHKIRRLLARSRKWL